MAQQLIFFRISFAPYAAVFPKKLALYLKSLKLSVFAILALKSIASCFIIYFIRLYKGITESKSSASSTVTWVTWCLIILISPLTKM